MRSHLQQMKNISIQSRQKFQCGLRERVCKCVCCILHLNDTHIWEWENSENSLLCYIFYTHGLCDWLTRFECIRLHIVMLLSLVFSHSLSHKHTLNEHMRLSYQQLCIQDTQVSSHLACRCGTTSVLILKHSPVNDKFCLHEFSKAIT